MSDETQAVTITFPSKAMANLFIAWMADQDTYADLYQIVADDTGMYTSFEKPTGGRLQCRVVITGRVVDDDDPEMQGISEEEE